MKATTTNKIVYIPFNKLFVSPANVRVVSPSVEADSRLMASILADGLLQNLAVIEAENGFEVIAGGRRFGAVGKLVEQGSLKPTYEIPCMVKDYASATAVSLAENIAREEMHPADIFMAYKKLKTEGLSEKEIAKKYGDSTTQVKKLMRLASVAPELVAAFRNGEMDLDLIMAFTVSTDTKAQLACWQEVSRGNPSPRQVRNMLLNTDVESSDSRAKFVTLKTYKAAGGRIATDLFQEKEYILDETLLNELVMKKLTDASDALVALGWKWVVIEEEGYDYLSLFSYKKIDVERVGAPDELLHKLAAAEQELKEFDDLPWSPENDDRQASLEALVLSLTNKLDAFCQFTPDQISSAGAFVTYSDEGELLVLRGYMTFADRQALEGETVGESDDDEEEFEGDDEELGSDDEEDEESVEPEVISDDISYSQAHVADMNCYYRQGLQAELVKHEALAYDLLVFTLADQLLGSARAYELPLDIRATTPHLIGVDIDETGAASVLNSAKNGLDLSWTEIKAQDVRFSAFCELSAAMKASILAYCVGVTSLGQPMKKHCKVLSLVAEKTNFSLQKYWQPTAANYFSRIDKASIASIGSALTGKDFEKTHEKAKKSELASFVEKMPEVKGWLPTYLK